MWARVTEILLGVWLVISPMVMRDTRPEVWAVDLTAGGAVILLASLSYAHRLRHAHVGIFGLALVLGLYGYFGERPLGAAAQNHVLVGILLMMFGIIPNRASTPPASWREWERARETEES